MIMSVVCCIFISKIFCNVDYTMNMGGLITQRGVLSKFVDKMNVIDVHIQKEKDETKCDIVSKIKGINNDRSIISLVNYRVMKDMFYSEFSSQPTSIVRLITNLSYTVCQNDNTSVQNLVTFDNEDKYGFTLHHNNEFILKYLLGRTIINCVEGFATGIKGLREEITKIISGTEKLKLTYKLKHFASLKDLLEAFKNFFFEVRFDMKDSKDAFMKFMTFFDTQLSNPRLLNIDNNILRADFIKALNCAKDFANLCSAIKSFDRSMFSIISLYNYKKQEKISVDKALIITFPCNLTLSDYSRSIELIDSKKKIVGDRKHVDFITHHVIITLKTLCENDLKYIKINVSGKDVLIDISKFNILNRE
ncbi:hypothetical protein NGRA_0957 [Nosema granulosis]|uniref:Uncharacterized protein n=1 Tax=Nosema granulosis TaxID=83296 RepID=A0A9P6GZV3_9MICR|nr:hypothetical protein NGRA_0957 [Nosema granulosis]